MSRASVAVRFLAPCREPGGAQYAPGERADVSETFGAWAITHGFAVAVQVAAPIKPPADKMVRGPGVQKAPR